MTDQTLALENVTAGVLQGVDLCIRPGEVVCLSGPSGSGKSRLLRAIADLDPHAGEITLGDTRQGRVPGHQWRRLVALVPAESQWWAEAVAAHFPGGQVPGLEDLGLPADAADWEVGRLSSGEKQRLALLRALARSPGALLLDEPTANLDPDSIARVEEWLRGVIRGQSLATLWVAHDQGQIERVADRHLHIRDGRLEVV